MNLVIIEGPDGSGKTTLAQAIAERHGYVYQHEGPPPPGEDLMLYYLRKLIVAHDLVVGKAARGVVFDRFAVGERVYGPLFRNKDGLGPSGGAVFGAVAARIGAVQIACLPPIVTCIKNRPEDDPSKLAKAWGAFSGFAPLYGHIRFDYTVHDFDAMVATPGRVVPRV